MLIHRLFSAGSMVLCLALVTGCAPAGNSTAERGTNAEIPLGGEQEWTPAEIEEAFDAEWSAWKVSKYKKMSQDARDALTERGVGSPREAVDYALERQAEPWKNDLRKQFAARVDGYRALLRRLGNEQHPDAQRERTAWFDALVVEVSGRSRN